MRVEELYHEMALDELVARLEKKGRSVAKHVPYFHGNRQVGEIDVLATENKHGFTHRTYYEVKTGYKHCRGDARDQARHFYQFHERHPEVKARFVFYHPTKGAEYWRKKDVL